MRFQWIEKAYFQKYWFKISWYNFYFPEISLSIYSFSSVIIIIIIIKS